MVAGQGGPADLLERPKAYLPEAAVIRPVFAADTGFIAAVDTRAVGLIVVELGGGRQRAEDRIDPAVGLSALSGPGQPVDADTPLAVIHASSEHDWQDAAAALRSAVRLGPEPPPSAPLVHDRIG
jgi:thymidine phosphorylase